MYTKCGNAIITYDEHTLFINKTPTADNMNKYKQLIQYAPYIF